MINDSVEISVSTTTDGAEIIADMLSSYTGEGVSIYDGKDVDEVLTSSTNWDYVDDNVLNKGGVVVVKGYISISEFDSVKEDIEKALENYKKEDFGINFGDLALSFREVSTTNWNEQWRKFYKPIVLDKIAVVPDWIEFEDSAKEIIRLEPGMAFGTGEHASTRLCLSLLEKLDLKNKKVIDVGTGSGILGIASAKLGATDVYMTDIDEKAVSVARENVVKNGVEELCLVECADLSDKIECDILIGNLTADILLRLLESIKDRLNKGVTLVLSGIIAERLDEVVNGYEKAGFKVKKLLKEDDWRALELEY